MHALLNGPEPVDLPRVSGTLTLRRNITGMQLHVDTLHVACTVRSTEQAEAAGPEFTFDRHGAYVVSRSDTARCVYGPRPGHGAAPATVLQ
ncbi:hypothetical protein OHA61_01025 [Streptomyces sp. NBC_00885]|uniref:hypothetical protein n=1 Tax=Streptomyces sp. NBC_00885 TaxID=2975857 RepID=UPI00386F1B23|nr:hypothetical protein OHA61_01025 [Streptomyces sp. NBC_00885]